ncbi:MAG: tyrosine-type recombinase/integrase [Solirubrobacteraceae bacterium]
MRRRFAPHQLRHAHAVEMAREGVPLPVIQRQLGHAHLGVTSTYLQGIDTTEIINTIHARRADDPSQCRTQTLTSSTAGGAIVPPAEHRSEGHSGQSRPRFSFRATQNDHGQRPDARRKTRAGLGRLSRCRGRAPRKSAVPSNGE